MSKYLPSDSRTGQAVALLKEEFGDEGEAVVMIDGISADGAAALYGKLSAELTGLAAVNYNPGTDYKGDKALYRIVLHSPDASEESETAIAKIMEVTAGHTAYLAGSSINAHRTRETTEKEAATITVVIAALIVIILVVTSKSFFEVPVLAVTFGAAALINMGTNFMLGGISYIANSISLVLQLALAIDYSVVLMHRFTEEREKLPPREAAAAALTRAIPEILSGSLTTVAGLTALMLMQLSIGIDLGLALSKGIIISLLTVIFLMPSLLVLSARPLKKTLHRSFVPNVTRPTRKLLTARKVIAPLFVAVIGAALAGQFFGSYTFNMTDSAALREAREAMTPAFGTMNTLVVLVEKGDYEKERALIAHVMEKESIDAVQGLSVLEAAPGMRLTDELTATQFGYFCAGTGLAAPEAAPILAGQLYGAYAMANGQAAQMTDPTAYKVQFLSLMEFIYANAGNPMMAGLLPQAALAQLAPLAAVRANFESQNYARIMFNIDGDVEGADSFALIEALESELKEFYPGVYLTGETAANFEMSRAFPGDNARVMIFTIAFVLIILLFTFRNFGLPVLLVLAIQGGIWINFALPVLAGNPVNFIGYLMVCAVQMGATIDYAIILTSRYRQLRKEGGDRSDAMARAVNAVFPTVLTSGLVLTLTGFTLGIFGSETATSALGMLLGSGTLASLICVLFALPSLLLICERVTDKLNFPRLKGRGHKADKGEDKGENGEDNPQIVNSL
jgi:predicted RND superfamily exporter protein